MKVEAMVLSVINVQEAYAKALLLGRRALADRQQQRDVLGGHQPLLEVHVQDVRPLCTKVDAEAGAADALTVRASGYAARAATTRR